MSGKRVATKPKKKVKKRTLFTVFSMFNLFWYTIAVLVANFHDHMNFIGTDGGLVLCVDGWSLPCSLVSKSRTNLLMKVQGNHANLKGFDAGQADKSL